MSPGNYSQLTVEVLFSELIAPFCVTKDDHKFLYEMKKNHTKEIKLTRNCIPFLNRSGLGRSFCGQSLMIPFLKVVTNATSYFPAIDLAVLVRQVCMGHWDASGGSQEKLHLILHPHPISLERGAFLGEAVNILLYTALSPGFSPDHGQLGVHLWSLDRNGRNAILLIADDQTQVVQEFATDSVARAQCLVEQARCRLFRHAAPGTVWRIEISAG